MSSLVTLEVEGVDVVCRTAAAGRPAGPPIGVDVDELVLSTVRLDAAWASVHLPLHPCPEVLDGALRLLAGRAADAGLGLLLHLDDPAGAEGASLLRMAPIRGGPLAALAVVGIAVRRRATGCLRYVAADATFLIGRQLAAHPALVAAHLSASRSFDAQHCAGDRRLVELSYLPANAGTAALHEALETHDRTALADALA